MKLQLVKEWPAERIEFFYGKLLLEDGNLAVLAIDRNNAYCIMVFGKETPIRLALPEVKSFLDSSDDQRPALFAIDGFFGVVYGIDKLLLFNDYYSEPVKITIDNNQNGMPVIPLSYRVRYPSPISWGNTFPICFEDGLYKGDARYFGFLQVNVTEHEAKWKSCSKLNSQQFTHHKDHDFPPKIEQFCFDGENLLVYVPGGDITNVNKWGMDYFACAKISQEGNVLGFVIESDYLKAHAEKLGTNGIFSACMQYLILTPVFKSGSWKGKQKLFSFATNELIDIQLPYGKSKATIVQKRGADFWMYHWKDRVVHFSLCKRSEKVE